MHYHPEPDDPSRPPTYCWDHLPDDAKRNGYYECQCLREACVICEEADTTLYNAVARGAAWLDQAFPGWDKRPTTP